MSLYDRYVRLNFLPKNVTKFVKLGVIDHTKLAQNTNRLVRQFGNTFAVTAHFYKRFVFATKQVFFTIIVVNKQQLCLILTHYIIFQIKS